MFENMPDALTRSQTLAWHANFCDLVIAIEAAGAGTWTLTIRAGTAAISKGSPANAAFRLKAGAEDWQKFLMPEPPVGYQTLSSMFATHHLDIEGDYLAFSRHLRLVEGLFGSLRPGLPATPPSHAGTPRIEPVTGRYLRLDIEGRPHRVYFEEAGEGIPLLCLHTAGADGRQYRALLNDPEITSRFRVIVFDLPAHGKSSPPPGFQDELYMLTTDRYVGTVMAVKRALGLERPVVMGCSIGGRAVLHLALRHGDEFRAAIGLQSALFAEARSPEGSADMTQLYRPDVNGAETGAITVASLMAPQSPDTDRWETLWHYMQGGPGIFMGDLYYYFVDGDMRNGMAGGIDTAKCPLYLLSGEYDVSATPEMAAALAREVKATHFEVMKSLGHFPMSENPAQFRTYILPVLDRIHAAG